MPNHITNVLIVSGPENDVQEFFHKISSKNEEYLKRQAVAVKAQIEMLKKNNEGDCPSPFAPSVSDYEEILEKLENGEDPYDTPLTFKANIPYPYELEMTVSGNPGAKPQWQKDREKELKEKYGHDNWYSYNLEHFGTKWDAYSIEEPEDAVDGVSIKFQTAWSPPVPWIEETSKMFPTLTFVDEYINEGGGAGRIIAENGLVSDTETSEEDWLENYDEEYQRLQEAIETPSYDEFIESLKEMEGFYYPELHKRAVERIKHEDLPMFTDYEWAYEAEQICKERLRGAKHTD